ncbi:SigB/SigF/SigG family RNA polymerase sigma factor [Catellatospora sp. KI3]|uniref:SigB/SigF/SigG family RNA polymerase sigma factor n=1 Tax=Catellatospora sp. KI3 TaxID=3041620 RepID=UPI002482CDC1|nr:SigB/SigF/SigG family RNA polymerase sigma factor [Catellatospora sp. KI3]MDI1460682.1 SigB/SigF/SigG family RNA polymerase sigma factor [Catellatospora sp. KI3]
MTTTKFLEPDPGSETPTADCEQALSLLHRLPPEDAGTMRLRNEIICRCLPMARRLAERFRNRGEDVQDLIQVATIGLINSVDRFDPDRGVPFAYFAAPTILGEIKRHFRDRTWTLHVYRSLQDLHVAVCRVVPELTQALQRTPTAADIAASLKVDVAEVQQAMECSAAHTTGSINAPITGDDRDSQMGDLLGAPDSTLEGVADRQVLYDAIATLPERDQRILRMRFVDGLTQSEIAAQIGVSQMQISRLLARTFDRLREQLTIDD